MGSQRMLLRAVSGGRKSWPDIKNLTVSIDAFLYIIVGRFMETIEATRRVLAVLRRVTSHGNLAAL